MSLQVTEDRQARSSCDNEGASTAGQLFDLPPYADIRVGARNLSELGYAEISSTPGGFVGFLPTARLETTTGSRPSFMQATLPQTGRAAGSRACPSRPAPTLPLPLCQRIAKAADVDTSAAD